MAHDGSSDGAGAKKSAVMGAGWAKHEQTSDELDDSNQNSTVRLHIDIRKDGHRLGMGSEFEIQGLAYDDDGCLLYTSDAADE